jgi:hypothetical protein
MHFRPVEQSMDDEYLGQGGGGGSVDATAMVTAMAPEAEAGSGSGGLYSSLDDVFGSESDSFPASGDDGNATAVVTSLDRPGSPRHPSDMRRLETEHATAGYREGISTAKEKTVQAGFDEGFSLGATIGLAAGQLLGMLEGIDDALKSRLGGQAGSQAGSQDGQGTSSAAATSELLVEAKQELSVLKIFSPDYWAPDGNWSYDVEPHGDGDEILFPDVAKAHPLIRKWTAVVDEQARLWKIDRSVLDGDAGMEAAAEDATTAGTSTATIPLPLPASRQQPLDW